MKFRGAVGRALFGKFRQEPRAAEEPKPPVALDPEDVFRQVEETLGPRVAQLARELARRGQGTVRISMYNYMDTPDPANYPGPFPFLRRGVVVSNDWIAVDVKGDMVEWINLDVMPRW